MPIDANTNAELKTTFWPMVGGIGEGFTNYLEILRRAGQGDLDREGFFRWLMTTFHLEESYARNVLTTLLFGPGLVATEGGRCVLTPMGREILDKAKPEVLYEIFAKRFVGVADIVEILNSSQPLTREKLFEAWRTRVMGSPAPPNWSVRHAKMQFTHRLDWLRSLSFVNKVADSYYLSKTGMAELTKGKVSGAKGKDEAEAISHSAIEDKLRLIGEFFEFMSIKRAAVNEARPPSAAKLTENRQLDCLWARVVHFGGKVQYAFEVQVGGNIADAIERLEMVAPFVQKAVVVSDESQQKTIQERLEIKHSGSSTIPVEYRSGLKFDYAQNGNTGRTV